jgi:MoaA/NifB/PqqE/SkfB family radical SAM enzyme
LSSCNYGCNYCPFAKKKNTRAELTEDARQLARFITWVQQKSEHTFGILFTPWGEALIRKYYQEAIRELSFLPNIRKVAIQTNLSCPTKWLHTCNKEKVALWSTFHPSETTRNAFITKCKELDKTGIATV